jgi:RimJ/RimL family protein N-acetyltransferase
VFEQTTWIGFVIMLKSAQRTHVTTNAVGLLMNYALNTPSDASFSGLGLRRVQWTCDSGNLRSLAVSQRLGFQIEGTFRWRWVLPTGATAGDPPRSDDPVQGNGRHDTILGMCWDFWEREGRAIVSKQMARRS